MVKSNDNGSVSVAPFLKKCYEMVDDKSTDSIISWSQNTDSFVIWDMTEFSVQLLPKYFKHSNFSSFIRQLNIYGFKKVDSDRWEFANDGFIRGQKYLLSNICRRKNSQVSDQRKSLQQSEKSVEPSEKIANLALWKEVENLKTDKNILMHELVNLRQHQETADNKLLLLRDRLQGMEKSQQQMLSFLVMAMQNPSFLVQLLHPKENNWRIAEAGNMLEEVTEVGEPIASDNMIVRYQPPPVDETPKPVLKPVTDSGNQTESDTSDGMKDFFMNVDFLKMLMDETRAPFIPMDLLNEGEWEKLLLASPFSENIEDSQYKEGNTDSGMEVEPTVPGSDSEKLHSFELLLQQMGKYQSFESEPTDYGSHVKNSQNLEFVTEKMGLLASDSNQKV